MDPKRVDPITGLANFLGAFSKDMADPQGAFDRNRATATNTKLGNTTIDTCKPSDTNIYETGIERMDIEREWIIVEQYEGGKEAGVGHDKWVKLLSDYPDYPLRDIDSWSLDEPQGGEL